MNKSITIHGWHIHHHEKLIYHANAGTPSFRLKFFQYPPYRQTVAIRKHPNKCQIKSKGQNMYFVFHQKVGSKGIISLERIIDIHPLPSFHTITENWGKISCIPDKLKQKYQQKSSYWPLHTKTIQNITDQQWFHTDDLSLWVQSASRNIKEKIRYSEKQETRLGAEQAYLTGIGDCDEFTDLFITFARMRGIPCRRLTGYFIKITPDINAEPHAWAEIFSSTLGWLPIDIPLRNLGSHYINYIILKIEEFNPSLPEYQIHTTQSTTVHSQWETPPPSITPITLNSHNLLH
ncbi:MAG: transglutaminase-like domain-containing protein [Candidatus Thermoplasmatota archaeon]|nr:transglutaminase-like domain-containing protein [Candidatus Thermoplasmatota archaeon]MBU1941468.1 transglutaminase-like domain-containing protein [Candidatus Thermoplasmatota archaeon]